MFPKLTLTLFFIAVLSSLSAAAGISVNVQEVIKSGNLELTNLYAEKQDETKTHDADKKPSLHLAIKKKQKKTIKKLLDNNTNPNQTDGQGQTPLLLAIQSGDIKIVKLLLQKGADVNLKGIVKKRSVRVGQSIEIHNPLSHEERRGKDKLVKTILKEISPLSEAVNLNEPEMALLLLQSGAEISSTGEGILHLALHRTFKKGAPKLISALQEKGAEITESDRALMLALRYGMMHQLYNLVDEVAKKLVQSPKFNDLRRSVFHKILRYKNVEIDEKLANIFIQHGLAEDIIEPKNVPSWFIPAVKSNKIKTIRAFLDCGVNPNIDFLRYAVKASKFEIAEVLLQHGVDINLLEEGIGKYIADIDNRRDNIIKLFLKYNADLDKLYAKNTPLWHAAYRGKTKWIEYLFKKNAKPGPRDVKAIDIMKAAAGASQSKAVKLLIQYGYPVDNIQMKSEDKTPLCLALNSYHPSTETVSILLEAGAFIEHSCMHDSFLKTIKNGHEDIIRQLLAYGINGDYRKCQAFIHSKKQMDIQLAKTLFQGVAINEADQQGLTLLMRACQAGRSDIAKVIVEQQADVNIVDKSQTTALMMASQKGKADIVRMLLDYGAEINTAGMNGETALFYAVRSENIEIVKMLVEKGAEVNHTGLFGMNAYTIAMIKKKSAMAEYLLNHGADRNQYDKFEDERRTILDEKVFFPEGNENLSLDQYLQFKIWLKMAGGIDDPVNWQPNPKLSTPEKTWAYYKKMLITGKIEKAIKCHLPGSADRFREIFNLMGKQNIVKMVQAMSEIEQIMKEKQTAEYRLLREEKGVPITYYVYFNNVFGEWKIVDY